MIRGLDISLIRFIARSLDFRKVARLEICSVVLGTTCEDNKINKQKIEKTYLRCLRKNKYESTAMYEPNRFIIEKTNTHSRIYILFKVNLASYTQNIIH